MAPSSPPRETVAESTRPVADDGALFVFFSFDLVNSTRYKSVNKEGWPFVARHFYEAVIDGLTKWLDGFRVWKYVGDEVLVFKHVSCGEQLRKCLEAAMEVILSSTASIHNAFADAKKLLAVKGTVWCAKIAGFGERQQEMAGPTQRNSLNLVFRSRDSQGGQIDFLGPDIDVGFRIAKYTLRRRLVVGAELAYLLFLDRASHASIEKNLKIVSYEVLRGVWDDRRYPILWYERDWDDVKSSFLYDERYDNEIVSRIWKDPKELGSLQELTKVFEDQDRLNELRGVWDDLKGGRLADEATILDRVTELATKIEVHCVAACFREDGRVLVAKRQADKRRYPGVWEFGCGQLAEGETFEQCLRRHYKADFGIELDFHGEPRPVKSYVIPGDATHPAIPGVIFVATVLNSSEAKPKKHAEIDWVDPHKATDDRDRKYVPDAGLLLRLALHARAELTRDNSGRQPNL